MICSNRIASQREACFRWSGRSRVSAGTDRRSPQCPVFRCQQTAPPAFFQGAAALRHCPNSICSPCSVWRYLVISPLQCRRVSNLWQKNRVVARYAGLLTLISLANRSDRYLVRLCPVMRDQAPPARRRVSAVRCRVDCEGIGRVLPGMRWLYPAGWGSCTGRNHRVTPAGAAVTGSRSGSR